MNLCHLGDALDSWKGWVVGKLRNVLKDVRVLPMFTDEDVRATWNNARLELYARLTGLADANRILRPDIRFTAGTRGAYFDLDATLDGSDLFVDPDTGIEPPQGGGVRHIRVAEVVQLLPPESHRLLLVYQHSFREENWVDARLQHVLRDLPARYVAFALWAGSVSMVFISCDRGRLTACRGTLREIMVPLEPERARVTEIHEGQAADAKVAV